MPAAQNRQVLLKSRPTGEPTGENFELVASPIPDPGPGQFLARTLYLSLDPYMRGRMSARASYADPAPLGQPMVGGTVGQVVRSHHPDYPEGAYVLGYWGWQDFGLSDGTGARRLDPAAGPLSYALGILGMPGFTAYTGLLNIGQPQPGETLVVAAASGAVGSVVGQIGKLKDCRVVGIAGGERKCRYVETELGFDAALDHRQGGLPERLQAACPNGIDIDFESVGGPVFDAVLPLLNMFARVPVCGLVAHYNDTELPPGPNRVPLLMQAILTRRLTFRGFIVSDFAPQFPEFLADMTGWLRDGRVRYREDLTDGLENAPRSLIGLLRGENFGKKIIRVADDPTRSAGH